MAAMPAEQQQAVQWHGNPLHCVTSSFRLSPLLRQFASAQQGTPSPHSHSHNGSQQSQLSSPPSPTPIRAGLVTPTPAAWGTTSTTGVGPLFTHHNDLYSEEEASAGKAELEQNIKTLKDCLAREQELRNKLQLRLLGANSTIKALRERAQHSRMEGGGGEEAQYLQQVASHQLKLQQLQASICTAQQQLSADQHRPPQAAGALMTDTYEADPIRRKLLHSPSSSAGGSPRLTHAWHSKRPNRFVTTSTQYGCEPMPPKELGELLSPSAEPSGVMPTQGLTSHFSLAAYLPAASAAVPAAAAYQAPLVSVPVSVPMRISDDSWPASNPRSPTGAAAAPAWAGAAVDGLPEAGPRAQDVGMGDAPPRVAACTPDQHSGELPKVAAWAVQLKQLQDGQPSPDAASAMLDGLQAPLAGRATGAGLSSQQQELAAGHTGPRAGALGRQVRRLLELNSPQASPLQQGLAHPVACNNSTYQAEQHQVHLQSQLGVGHLPEASRAAWPHSPAAAQEVSPGQGSLVSRLLAHFGMDGEGAAAAAAAAAAGTAASLPGTAAAARAAAAVTGDTAPGYSLPPPPDNGIAAPDVPQPLRLSAAAGFYQGLVLAGGCGAAGASASSTRSSTSSGARASSTGTTTTPAHLGASLTALLQRLDPSLNPSTVTPVVSLRDKYGCGQTPAAGGCRSCVPHGAMRGEAASQAHLTPAHGQGLGVGMAGPAHQLLAGPTPSVMSVGGAAPAPTPTDLQAVFDREGRGTLAVLDAIQSWAEGAILQVKQQLVEEDTAAREAAALLATGGPQCAATLLPALAVLTQLPQPQQPQQQQPQQQHQEAVPAATARVGQCGQQVAQHADACTSPVDFSRGTCEGVQCGLLQPPGEGVCQGVQASGPLTVCVGAQTPAPATSSAAVQTSGVTSSSVAAQTSPATPHAQCRSVQTSPTTSAAVCCRSVQTSPVAATGVLGLHSATSQPLRLPASITQCTSASRAPQSMAHAGTAAAPAPSSVQATSALFAMAPDTSAGSLDAHSRASLPSGVRVMEAIAALNAAVGTSMVPSFVAEPHKAGFKPAAMRGPNRAVSATSGVQPRSHEPGSVLSSTAGPVPAGSTHALTSPAAACTANQASSAQSAQRHKRRTPKKQAHKAGMGTQPRTQAPGAAAPQQQQVGVWEELASEFAAATPNSLASTRPLASHSTAAGATASSAHMPHMLQQQPGGCWDGAADSPDAAAAAAMSGMGAGEGPCEWADLMGESGSLGPRDQQGSGMLPGADAAGPGRHSSKALALRPFIGALGAGVEPAAQGLAAGDVGPSKDQQAMCEGFRDVSYAASNGTGGREVMSSQVSELGSECRTSLPPAELLTLGEGGEGGSMGAPLSPVRESAAKCGCFGRLWGGARRANRATIGPSAGRA